MDMRKLVGRNVRRIREKKRLTQEQFAEISGFSQQYLSGLERGQRNPTVVTVYEIAVALGVSHLDLLRPTRKSGKSPTRQQLSHKERKTAQCHRITASSSLISASAQI